MREGGGRLRGRRQPSTEEEGGRAAQLWRTGEDFGRRRGEEWGFERGEEKISGGGCACLEGGGGWPDPATSMVQRDQRGGGRARGGGGRPAWVEERRGGGFGWRREGEKRKIRLGWGGQEGERVTWRVGGHAMSSIRPSTRQPIRRQK